MDIKTKELLLEKFEVISKTSDDCTYILEDYKNLTKDEIKHKLYARFDRITNEMNEIDEELDLCFESQRMENRP